MKEKMSTSKKLSIISIAVICLLFLASLIITLIGFAVESRLIGVGWAYLWDFCSCGL